MLECLRELPAASRFAFCGDAAARAAVSAAFGVTLPETACRAAMGAGRAALWLGPDEYLLWTQTRELGVDVLANLEQALAGMAHSLVDVSHRQVAWEISGPRAAEILSGGCPLDLDISRFPVGMCTRTLLAKADVVLWRTDAEVFHLEAWRSFSAYVSELLTEIGALCGPTSTPA